VFVLLADLISGDLFDPWEASYMKHSKIKLVLTEQIKQEATQDIELTKKSCGRIPLIHFNFVPFSHFIV